MNEPLLIPHGIQGFGGYFRQRPGEIRSAESAEPVFRSRSDVGVARVHRSPYRAKHEECSEVRLIEDVHVRISRQAPAIMQITQLRIDLVLLAGDVAILDNQPVAEARHVVDVRQIGHQLLPEGLCS